MAIQNFVEKLFPEDISYGAKGGPQFKTEVFTASSGAEQRNVNWSESRGEWDVGHGIRDKADMDLILAFFYAVRGKGTGFRFRDWTDYEVLAETIGTGDGIITTYQVTKTYDMASGQPYIRTITKVNATVIQNLTVNGVVMIEGTNYTIDRNTGIITFSVAPGLGDAIVVGSLEFDVPVRFDTDKIDIVAEAFELESWTSIKLVELRDAT